MIKAWLIGLLGWVAVSFLAGAPQGGIRVSATTPKGKVDCDQPGELSVTGSVLEAHKGDFVLDLCMPTQDCSGPIRAEFSVSVPDFEGFEHYLKHDAFVHVELETRRIKGACAMRIQVTGVASWVGARNPVGRPDEFYFAAGENITELFPKSPFDLKKGRQRSGAQVHLIRTGERDSGFGWTYWVSGTSF